MSIAEDMRQATVRFRQLAHLDSAAPDGDLDSDVEEWLLDFAEQLGFELEKYDGYYDDSERLHEELIDKGWTSNWFGEVHVPIGFKFSEDGRTFAFSWGMTHMTIVTASTYEELVAKACEWGKEQLALDHAREREKAGT